MIPPSFEYFAPKTLDEAISLLQRLGPEAKILSGGQSLIPLMKLRLAAPPYLIDINRVAGLDYITESGGFIRIGALVREADLESSELIRSRCPILIDTAAVIADPLVRSQATVCGNLAHGDPANDHPATMLALDAEVVIRGPAGERRVRVADFFQGLFATVLKPDEILTEICIPVPGPSSGGAYFKLERKVGDFATAGVAAQVTINDSGFQRVGIGLTNVGLAPLTARRAETFLKGKKPSPDVINRAAGLAAEDSEPIGDIKGPVEYKRDLVRVLAIRALNRALERAKGGS